jgi:hypothetical protein
MARLPAKRDEDQAPQPIALSGAPVAERLSLTLGMLTRRPMRFLPWAGLALLVGAGADLVQPGLPALRRLATGAAILGGVAVAARLAWPRAGWTAVLLSAALPAAILLPLLALAQGDLPRGLIASRVRFAAALQDAVFPPAPDPPLPAERLQAMLAEPRALPRPRPGSADEALFNALLHHRRDAPLPAAQALALAFRLSPEARPDALVLQETLWNGGVATVREALAELPGDLAPAARAHVEATRIADAAGRAEALAALLAAHPDALEAVPPLARALLRAALPEGPTVALAARLVALADAFTDPARAEALAARALDPTLPARLAEELRGLEAWRDLAARRLSVSALAPPPGMPGLPMLVRATPPERWRSVQVLDRAGTPQEAWVEVPQRQETTTEAARDPAPTLRLPPPWRAREFRFRYIDREGVAAATVAFTLDPVAAMREAAQRALIRQGPFALYLPGRIGPTRLNPYPVAGHLRPGLAALEWHTDVDRRLRRVELGVTDAQVLAGNAPRGVADFEIPPTAQSIFLTAIYADGSRSDVQELPIR